MFPVLIWCVPCRQVFPGQSSSQVTATLRPSQSTIRSLSPMQPSSINNQRFFSCWPRASVNYGNVKHAPATKNVPTNFSHINKETWTHEFCVLADKYQRKVPTTSMKQ